VGLAWESGPLSLNLQSKVTCTAPTGVQDTIACNRVSRQRPPRDGHTTEILQFALNPPGPLGLLLTPWAIHGNTENHLIIDSRPYLPLVPPSGVLTLRWRRPSSPLRRQSHLPPQVSPSARGPPPGHWQTLLFAAVIVAASCTGLHGPPPYCPR
jgi:hypothetical protein